MRLRPEFLQSLVMSYVVAITVGCAIRHNCAPVTDVADNTSALVRTDWSKPVWFNHRGIRGRLLILEGSEPAYGGPKTENHASMFLELQHVSGACCPSVKLYFDVMGLNGELVDADATPIPLDGVIWGGRGPMSPRWVVLPYNSTIRLFINSGSRSPLQIHQNGEPWCRWSIKADNSKVYFFSATFNISIPTNSTLTATSPESLGLGYHDYANWEGKLIIPRTRIVVKEQ